MNLSLSVVPAVTLPPSGTEIAVTAYNGAPFSSPEQDLLTNNVGIVIRETPGASQLQQISSVAPHTPQLLYTNVSSLYLDPNAQNADADTLSGWLKTADANGYNREDAFYHLTQPAGFQLDAAPAPSSEAVQWFTGVYAGSASATTGLTNLTLPAYGDGGNGVAFGGAGDALYVGYTERFDRITVNLSQAPQNGWNYTLQYATRNGQGQLTWATLQPTSDTTNGLTQSGTIQFYPPTATTWTATTLTGTADVNSPYAYYVRFLTTSSSGTPPTAATLEGYNYVGGDGQTNGIIPAWDATADGDNDGYLNDTEWAAAVKALGVPASEVARFAYQSRVIYNIPQSNTPANTIQGAYGEMRFATNPAALDFQQWATSYEQNLLSTNTLAAGLYMDNSGAISPVATVTVSEQDTSAYSSDYAALLGGIDQTIAPAWILPNVAQAGSTANAVVAATGSYFAEGAVQPLYNTWSGFQAIAAQIAGYTSAAASPPFAVLSSSPVNRTTGQALPADPRSELASVAEYYLLADPASTLLDLNAAGPQVKAASWTRQWAGAEAFDIGQPNGSWSLFASGTDPASALGDPPPGTSYQYQVYQRDYSNALVLFRPLSYDSAKTDGYTTTGDASAETFALSGTYYYLNADGTLQRDQYGNLVQITSVTLRNGEGAILVKAPGASDTFAPNPDLTSRTLGQNSWTVQPIPGSGFTVKNGYTGQPAYNGVVVGNNSTAGQENVATVSGLSLQDAQVDADVTVVPNYTASLLARYQSPGNGSYYAGGLSRDGAGNYYYFIGKVNSGGVWSYPLAQTAVTLSAGTHHVTFSVTDASGGGAQLDLYIDGTEYGPVIDTNNAITTAGQVGIRGRDAATFDNFVATDLATVNGSTPYLIAFSDGFTQASTLGSAAPWTVTAGDGSFALSGGQAVGGGTPPTAQVNLATVTGLSTLNAVLQAKLTVGQGETAALLARYAGPGDTQFYAGALLRDTTDTYKAGIFVPNAGGTQTWLTPQVQITSAAGASHVLRFVVEGSTLSLFVDGILVASTTDSTYGNAGQVGIFNLGMGGTSFDGFTVIEPQAPAAPDPFSDTFSLPDQAPLTPFSWVDALGGFAVQGGRAVAQGTAGNATAHGDTQNTSLSTLNGVSQAAVTVQADVTLSAAGDGAGVVARYTGAYNAETQGDTQTYYAGVLWLDTQGSSPAYDAEIWKVIDGTVTVLATGTTLLGTEDSPPQGALLFEVSGTLLQLYVDGVLCVSTTDDSIPGAGTVGILAGHQGDAFDNFSFSTAAPLASDTFPQMDGSPLDNTLWAAAAGQFEVEGGRATAVGSGNAPALAIVNGVMPDDPVVEADVTLANPDTDAELIARYNGVNKVGDSNYYAGGIYRDNSGNYFAFVEMVDGQGLPNHLNKNPYLMPLAVLPSVVSHHLQFEVVSTPWGSKTYFTLSLYVDGVLAASATDTSGNYLSGSVGIRADTANGAAFDNFEVTSISEYFGDHFTRADGPLGSAWVGGSTQAGGQGFTVSGGEALATTAPADTPPDLAVVAGASAADVSVEASVVLTGAGDTAGVVARYQTGGSYYAGVLAYESGSMQYVAEIDVFVNGQMTTLQPTSAGLGSLSGEQRLRLDVLGNSLALYWDGTLEVQLSDTTLATPGAVGMFGSAGDAVDDFSARSVGEPFDAVSAANTPVFSDTFGGASLRGSWTVANTGNTIGVNGEQALIGSAQGVGVGMAGVPTTAGLTDVVVEADVTVANEGDSATLLARYNGAPDASASFYSASLYLDASGVYWGFIKKKYDGAWADSSNSTWTEPVSSELPASAGSAPFHLRFEVIGNTLSLYVNGVLVVSTKDLDPTSPPSGYVAYLSSGQVGIRGFYNDSFDNFQVLSVSPLASDAFGYNSSLGHVWNVAGSTTFMANYGVATGQGSGGTPDVATVANAALTDVSVSAGVKLAAQGDEAGVLARAQTVAGGQDYYAGVLYRDSSDNYYAEIWLTQGSATTLLVKSASLGNLVNDTADTVRLEVLGQALALYVNGIVYARATDGTLTGPGAVGMIADANDVMSNFRALPVGRAFAFSGGSSGALSDTFSQPDNASLSGLWTTKATGGTFNVQGGAAKDGGGVALALMGANLTNVGVDADVVVPENTNAALLVRAQAGGTDGAYYAGILRCDSSGNYTAWIMASDDGGVQHNLVTPQPVTLSVGAPVHLRFEAFGTELYFYVNGVLLPITSDPASPNYPAGAVGIRANGAGVTFDNFEVRVAPQFFGDAFDQNGALSSSWVTPNGAGGFSLIGTAAQGNTPVPSGQPGDVALVAGLSLTDVSVRALVPAPASGTSVGLVARYQGSGAYYYAALAPRSESGTYTATIYLVQPGDSPQVLQSCTVKNYDGSDPADLCFDVAGDSLALYVNGTVAVQTVNDTLSGPGAVGMFADGNDSLDNFTAEPL